MYRLLILFLALALMGRCKINDAPTELSWMTMEDISQLASSSKNDKKVLVDVYTDWCGWCKVMDRKTFSDPEVIAYLSKNFHVVKFDAEQREAVNYRGKVYEWQPAGRRGINLLGYELLKGKMSFPSLVYLNENLDPIKVSPGFKEPAQLLAELKSL